MAEEHVYEKNDRKMSDFEIIKRTYVFIKPYIWKLALVLLGMIVMIGLDLLASVLPGTITTELSKEIASELNMPYIFFLCGLTFVTYMLNTLFVYITAISLQKIGQKIIYDIRLVVFNHIENMSISQINEIPVGSLVTRVASDTNALSNLFTTTIVNLIKEFLTLVGVIIVMYVINWKIATILMFFLPVIFVISIVFRKYSRANYRKVRYSFSVMNAFLNESISGMKITQIFNQEKRKEEEFNRLNKDIVNTLQTDVKIFAFYRPTITLIYYIALACIFGFGCYFYLQDVSLNLITVGAMVGGVQMFYSLTSKFFNPIQNLADRLNELQRAFTSSERLYNLLDTKPNFIDEEDSIEITKFKGEIEFKNVWFAYKEGEWVLQDVSFHIHPNQTVAFVGATGAGKSTILQLIVRNYDVTKGQILIDGIDIKKVKIESLRKGIGQMLQDVFLFSGTIKSNINLRDEEITNEQIEQAVKYVNADQVINKQPHGIDEPVKEGGNNFSSGERQLLSFARTIVHNPQILILDEATANIDTETEKVIQDSLLKMMNVGTMLIVAHRLSTIQHSDNIICLQKGKIIESGNHQELLKKHGYYYNLYKLQYQDQEVNN